MGRKVASLSLGMKAEKASPKAVSIVSMVARSTWPSSSSVLSAAHPRPVLQRLDHEALEALHHQLHLRPLEAVAGEAEKGHQLDHRPRTQPGGRLLVDGVNRLKERPLGHLPGEQRPGGGQLRAKATGHHLVGGGGGHRGGYLQQVEEDGAKVGLREKGGKTGGSATAQKLVQRADVAQEEDVVQVEVRLLMLLLATTSPRSTSSRLLDDGAQVGEAVEGHADQQLRQRQQTAALQVLQRLSARGGDGGGGGRHRRWSLFIFSIFGFFALLPLALLLLAHQLNRRRHLADLEQQRREDLILLLAVLLPFLAILFFFFFSLRPFSFRSSSSHHHSCLTASLNEAGGKLDRRHRQLQIVQRQLVQAVDALSLGDQVGGQGAEDRQRQLGRHLLHRHLQQLLIEQLQGLPLDQAVRGGGGGGSLLGDHLNQAAAAEQSVVLEQRLVQRRLNSPSVGDQGGLQVAGTSSSSLSQRDNHLQQLAEHVNEERRVGQLSRSCCCPGPPAPRQAFTNGVLPMRATTRRSTSTPQAALSESKAMRLVKALQMASEAAVNSSRAFSWSSLVDSCCCCSLRWTVQKKPRGFIFRLHLLLSALPSLQVVVKELAIKEVEQRAERLQLRLRRKAGQQRQQKALHHLPLGASAVVALKEHRLLEQAHRDDREVLAFAQQDNELGEEGQAAVGGHVGEGLHEDGDDVGANVLLTLDLDLLLLLLFLRLFNFLFLLHHFSIYSCVLAFLFFERRLFRRLTVHLLLLLLHHLPALHSSLEGNGQHRLERLKENLQRVLVVALLQTGADEGEDLHEVVEQGAAKVGGHLADEQQRQALRLANA
ncbi:hypothetical protein TYRP_002692 [Tyrophagus putrescentiae]|nr:hypothetical protein TYRP_002692 [Tyrophagus putrescentiae]